MSGSSTMLPPARARGRGAPPQAWACLLALCCARLHCSTAALLPTRAAVGWAIRAAGMMVVVQPSPLRVRQRCIPTAAPAHLHVQGRTMRFLTPLWSPSTLVALLWCLQCAGRSRAPQELRSGGAALLVSAVAGSELFCCECVVTGLCTQTKRLHSSPQQLRACACVAMQQVGWHAVHASPARPCRAPAR